MTSVNTNYGASVALQNLNATNKALMETQNRINTGLKISGPKDNGAIYNIAQGMRSDVQAFGAVQRSLDRTVSVVDTAIAAGTNVSDLLKEMKEKALAARDSTIDNTARTAYDTDFKALRDQITKTLANAAFDGSNLVNGGSNLAALANADGTSFITVTARNLSEAEGAPDARLDNAVAFDIHGDVSAAVQPMPVRFVTEVEIDTGAATLRD
jgi:flagellin